MAMNFSLKIKSYALCRDFLKLIYNGEEYTLPEFSKKYKDGIFSLEKMLPQCEIEYRSKRMTFDEYKNNIASLASQLGFYTRHHDEIMPHEIGFAANDPDYYKAAKFLEKAENCIQTARYYFINSADILEYDCCINWKAGYEGIYHIRTMNFSTAIIWYNNCFDYIIQIAFLAFGLYKNMKKLNDDSSLEEILKQCTYNNLKMICEKKKDEEGFSILWDIIERCRNDRQTLNDWANYSKHKGGLGFYGLNPEMPLKLYVATEGEDCESRLSDFEPCKIDIDSSIDIVVQAHNALIRCLDELINFINFDAAKIIQMDGKIIYPDKKKYRKIYIE